MIKRLCDFIVSFLALILFLPIIFYLAWKIKKELGSPVFFTQNRPGLNGVIFKMVKFRSMLNTVDEYGNILSDEERLTTFGKKLRSSSLDELPELWNVLKGDMSLVGPRPLLVEYLPLYSEQQAKRHDVKPGITGWAQINGRNAISWEAKFKLDLWYVENHTLWLDIKILFMTLKKVIRKEDISAEGQATIKPFQGDA